MEGQRTDQIRAVAVFAWNDLGHLERCKDHNLPLTLHRFANGLGDLRPGTDAAANGDLFHIQHRLNGIESRCRIPAKLAQGLDRFRLTGIIRFKELEAVHPRDGLFPPFCKAIEPKQAGGREIVGQNDVCPAHLPYGHAAGQLFEACPEHRKLSGSEAVPHPDFMVQDDAAASAGAQHDHQAVLDVGQRTAPRFGTGGALAVVGDGHRHAEQSFQLRTHRGLPDELEHPAGVGNAVGGVDPTRHRDGYALILPGKLLFQGGDAGQHPIQILASGIDLALLEEGTVLIH